jgi:dienelactone hydrolase
MARPSTAPQGAVMIVHGGAGLDAHAKQQALRFAELGYAAFACDMYGDEVAGNRERIIATIEHLRSDRQRMRERAEAGLRVLRRESAVERPVAVVGYCFGGMVTLELARSGLDEAAVVSVHGTLATRQPARPGDIKAPILVCHGALDPHVPLADVSAFASEMDAADADWQLVIYGGTFHGFTHQGAEASTPGVAYNEAADRRSLIAIETFLREAFAASPRVSPQ